MLKIFNLHQGHKRYLSNTSWLVAERILRLGLVLFVGIFVARYLGPSKFGLLNYAQSFVALFTTVATLGLEGILVRELVNQSDREGELLGTAFILNLFGTMLMFVLIAIAILISSDDTYANILIWIIAVPVVLHAFNVIDYSFQSKVQSKFVVFIHTFQILVSSLIKIALILFEAPLIAFALISFIDAIAIGAGLIWIYHRQSNSVFNWKWNGNLAKQLLKDAWPLMLSGMVISIYMRIDQVMIKEMLDNEAVGNYAAAVKLSTAWYFVPVAISTSVFSAIVNGKKLGEQVYLSRIQKLFDFMVWIAVAIAVPTTFLSEWVISILFGENYLPAANVLKIHIWAGIFVFLGVSSSKWLLSENLTLFSFYRTFVGAVCNIILNYFLIGPYGIEGAAYSTLISQFIASVLVYAATPKTRKIFFMQLQSVALVFAFRHLKPLYRNWVAAKKSP